MKGEVNLHEMGEMDNEALQMAINLRSENCRESILLIFVYCKVYKRSVSVFDSAGLR